MVARDSHPDVARLQNIDVPELINCFTDRQYNLQKKTNSNDLQNTTQKTNDQAPYTLQRLGLSSDAL
jgi:hypothetical protein